MHERGAQVPSEFKAAARGVCVCGVACASKNTREAVRGLSGHSRFLSPRRGCGRDVRELSGSLFRGDVASMMG